MVRAIAPPDGSAEATATTSGGGAVVDWSVSNFGDSVGEEDHNGEQAAAQHQHHQDCEGGEGFVGYSPTIRARIRTASIRFVNR